MSKKIVHTDKAPEPVGPYAQAIEADGWLYCSGQIPLDAATGEVFTGEIPEQTRRVMENVRAVLTAADMDFSNVVKATIYLTNIGDFAAMNEVYGTYFEGQPAARSCFQVGALPKGANVEVEVVAKRF